MAFWNKKSTPDGEQSQPPREEADPAFPPTSDPAQAPQAHEPPAALSPEAMQAAPAQAQEAKALSPEEAKQRAATSKHLLMSFGEIVSVMMRSPQFKNASLGDLEKLVVPAVVTGQFVVAEAQSKSSGFVTPVGVVIWATVSDEIDQRIMANPEQPIHLEASEWRSGLEQITYYLDDLLNKCRR